MSTRQMILGTIALGAIIATPRAVHAGYLYMAPSQSLCAMTIPAPIPFTVYVYYVSGGGAADQITAADFRIDGIPTAAQGVFLTTVADPEASVFTGDARVGIHVEFPTCTQNDMRLLCVLNGFWAGATPAPHSWIMRGITGESSCPLVRYCGEADAVPILGALLYVNPVNPPYHEPCQAQCSTIAVEGSTWSRVKAIYR